MDKSNAEKTQKLVTLKQNIEELTNENKQYTDILLRKDFYREYEFMRKEVIIFLRI